EKNVQNYDTHIYDNHRVFLSCRIHSIARFASLSDNFLILEISSTNFFLLHWYESFPFSASAFSHKSITSWVRDRLEVRAESFRLSYNSCGISLICNIGIMYEFCMTNLDLLWFRDRQLFAKILIQVCTYSYAQNLQLRRSH